MESLTTLLQSYRKALELAAVEAPQNEQALCLMLREELSALEEALTAGLTESVTESHLRQRQLFGRSFISGPEGEAAESAFNRVAQLIGPTP